MNKLIKNKYIFHFIGLPCSGKTTLGKQLKKYFESLSICSCLLDGDEIRSGLSSDLNFSEKDRLEQARRIVEISKIFYKNNIIPIITIISPLNNIQFYIKNELSSFNYKCIYLKCNIKECIKRDVKGMYQKAINGQIKNFTGINNTFEEPKKPDLTIETDKLTIYESFQKIKEFLGNLK